MGLIGSCIFERFEDVHNAIEHEKRIKGWLRIKKIALIVSVNPAWRDLSLEWYEQHAFQPAAALSGSPTKLSSEACGVWQASGSVHS
jgi:hypothetical protein